ncbi:MAG: peptidoglycan DD-metalloendopeptidase family protein [Deltaproteobacteria bacterium]|nr:peptidoglycan DD-metalloendopeptidase family protein [Deltaproteobacteria bacterium]
MNLFNRPRQVSLRVILLFFLVASVLTVLRPFKSDGSPAAEVGIVVASYLNLRPEPGLSRPPLKTLKAGDKVKIIEYLDSWIKVSHRNKVGYIRNRERYIRIVSIGENLKINGRTSDTDIERIRREAEDISRQIEKSEQEIITYTEKETAVIDNLNEMEISLDRAVKQIATLKPELKNLEKKIADAGLASENLVSRIQANEVYAAKRLVALYKLNKLGRVHVLASSESVYDIFLRKASLERILACDEKIRNNLLESKAELVKIRIQLTTRKMEKRSMEAALKKQIDTMSLESAKRSKLLDEIRKKKSLELAAIDSLKQSAIYLDQTIRSLSEKDTHSSPQVRTEGVNRRADDKRETSGKKFIALKGLLNMPVKGRIVKRFGPHRVKKFNVVNFRSGIDIQAERGEPVRAVSAGHVLYADWFKGYGNMIIIDHGDSYYTLYAHAEELFKVKGDFVENGEVIATVGDSGSMVGPVLYFEVRYRGKPVDPLEWIHRG